MSQRIGFTVHGRVQGVFFRAFTRDAAKKSHITGWVRNDSNGTVVGEAQGSTDALSKFVQDLNRGSEAAKVIKVEKQDLAVKDGETGFEQRS